MSLEQELARLAARPEAAWDPDIQDFLQRVKAGRDFTLQFWRRFRSDQEFAALVGGVLIESTRARGRDREREIAPSNLPITKEFHEACQYFWNRGPSNASSMTCSTHSIPPCGRSDATASCP